MIDLSSIDVSAFPHWLSPGGEVLLINADCMDVLPLLPKVDAAITSPPYNCGKDYGMHSDNQDLCAYWSEIESILNATVNALMPHGYLCVNHANYIGSRENRSFVPDELCPILSRCLPFVDWIIWNKGPANGAAWGNFRTSPRMRAQHENIWVHGGVEQMPPSNIEWDEWSRFTTSIWNIPTTGVDSSIHPAMMPIAVAYRLIMLYSPDRGTILDPFAGSFTTAVACIRTGRQCIAIEIEPKYFAIGKRQCEEALAIGSLFDPAALAAPNLFEETQ